MKIVNSHRAHCICVARYNKVVVFCFVWTFTSDLAHGRPHAGARGGALAPWKCCKVFYALAVTAKTCFEARFEGHMPPGNVLKGVLCINSEDLSFEGDD